MQIKKIFCCFLCCLISVSLVWAQESKPKEISKTASTASASAPSSQELVQQAWRASNEDNLSKIEELINTMLSGYEAKAKEQAGELKAFPSKDQIENYRIMSDMATILFIKAEILMRKGEKDNAKSLFRDIIQNYPWAQSWDPSRGSYWSIAEKAKASIDVIDGKITEDGQPKKTIRTTVHLQNPGKDIIVDYQKYGKFLNSGTKDYHYQVKDQAALAAAVGEGIYPNVTDIYKDPAYKKALKEKRLEGSQWDFVNSEDLEAAFFKWALAPESWGVRMFYIGIIFEKAKMYEQAIKAYHAIIVHFPNTIAWTYWQTPWYPGQAAISKIQHIIRMHPELNLEYKWGRIQILNSFDNDPKNDITITKPGVVRRLTALEAAKRKFHIEKVKTPLGKPIFYSSEGRVRFAKYQNGHWQLLVDDKPYIIKGIGYSPTKVGQSPDNGTLTNWMEEDLNHNGIIDGPYEAFVDKNLNNVQDPDEPSVGDFALMKEMGVNTLRLYHLPMKPSKELLRKMYKEYGFMVLMGDFLGKYAIGSGATWSEGTDYENPEHQKKMMETVKDMVNEFKDEPYILMWVLGNENNYGVASNADKKPEAYYQFVNDVAKMIKSIDPNHPVAICNGDTLYLDKFGKLAPDVDAYGANVYRGDYGFGSFWQQVSEAADKPTFITEYGAPAFSLNMSYQEAQEAQASYHKGNWLDILYNSAGYEEGSGNAVGGVAFEWVDEWWKNYEPARHDRKADVVGPFPGGYYFEEWFGLWGQGDGKNSPYLREPRKVYYTYKDLWNTKSGL